MANTLPFDNADLNSNAIATSAFVRGSGSYKEEPSGTSTTTSDGKIHRDILSIKRSASFKVRGNVVSTHNNAVGLGTTCILKQASTTVVSATATVKASYDASDDTTSIELMFTPVIA